MTRAPPPGPPWDLPLEQAPLAFVDLEMTGLDPTCDRIVEVCVERVVGGQCTDRLSTLADPGERVGGASHVHGLGAAELLGAPDFRAVGPRVIEILDGAIFVAHGAKWDVSFLMAECGRAGLPLRLEYWIDTLMLSRRAFAFHAHSLDALSCELGIDRGRAHRAGSDVRVTRAVFDRCVAQLAPESARDLWEVRVGEHRARCAILASCSAAVLGHVPVVVTYRASRRPPEPLTMVLQEVRADLDPPRVVGYQLPGRGRRQLRADRILRIDAAPDPAPDPA